MRASRDWIQHMLDLPMAKAPGAKFEYSNGVSFLLSAILQESIGINALAFAQKHLFGPLGIHEVDWPSNPQGITIGWGGMRIKPLDMATIGFLYLNKGVWEGEQVVSYEWVEVSTREQIKSGTLSDGYGYQWWVDKDGYYMALGYSGQYIVVLPQQNMVVIFTSALHSFSFFVPAMLLRNYIIPAAHSSTPLPDNPDGEKRLQSILHEISNPKAALVPALPEIAKKIRKDYILVKALALTNGAGQAVLQPEYNFISIPETVTAAEHAYKEAGITDPRREVDMAVVHDCFSITELITMEDLQFSPRGKAPEDVEAGTFALGGELSVNSDGGLKCFGHPLSASGLRMIYEIYKQIQGKAGERQLKKADIGLTHNVGGVCGFFNCTVALFGKP